MSIALAQPAAASGSAPAPVDPLQTAVPGWMLGVLAVGVCVLLVWAAWRWIHPEALKLTNAPGRPNRLPWPMLPGAYLVSVLAGSLVVGSADASEARLILAAVVQHSTLVGGCLLIAWWAFPLGLGRGLGLSLRHWPWDLLRGIIAWLGVLPVCMGLLMLSQALMPKGLQSPHRMLDIIVDPSAATWVRVVTVVTAVALAPLAEELFYRGLLQTALRTLSGSPWAAVTVSSGIFTAVHYFEPQALPALLALSVVLGYTYERSGRLIVPIIVHALFNAGFVLVALTTEGPIS